MKKIIAVVLAAFAVNAMAAPAVDTKAAPATAKTVSVKKHHKTKHHHHHHVKKSDAKKVSAPAKK